MIVAQMKHGPGSAEQRVERCTASGTRVLLPRALVADGAEMLVDAENDQDEFRGDA